MNFLAQNSFSLLWIISSIIIALLSQLFKSQGPLYHGGIYYIVFTCTYCLIILFFKKQLDQQKLTIKPLFFCLGVIPFLFISPIFENDHYRYIWEGKVILNGFNPYLLPPDHQELSNILFMPKKSIGFSHLTTIYPPLGLLWFGVVSFFNFQLGLKIMMILNALLVFFWLRLLRTFPIKNSLILICLPYLQKEFIGAIHLDLLASFFLLLLIMPLLNKKKLTWKKSMMLYGLSYWCKILGILSLPLYLLNSSLKKSFTIKKALTLLFLLVSLPIFFWLSIPSVSVLKGVLAFSKEWVWNPGFYSLLELFEYTTNSERRSYCFFVYAIMFIMILVKFQRGQKTQVQYLEANLLIYSGLMFFSPVFNGWYAIWFLPYALILNNHWGVLYAVMSCFSYLAYGHLQWRYYGHFINHSFFIIMIVKLFYPQIKKKYLSLHQ